jgi:gamma-carbonic anhydrase
VFASRTAGPNCLLSTCLIDNRAFIGEGCIILEHSWVAEYAMLAPGSVLQPFSYIPPGQVWAGNPARYVRDVEEDEKQFIRDTAQEAHDLGNAHAMEYALEYPMVSTSDGLPPSWLDSRRSTRATHANS